MGSQMASQRFTCSCKGVEVVVEPSWALPLLPRLKELTGDLKSDEPCSPEHIPAILQHSRKQAVGHMSQSSPSNFFLQIMIYMLSCLCLEEVLKYMITEEEVTTVKYHLED